MNAKISKLENQFNDAKANEEADAESGEKGIFVGVAIFVNGYTDPSSDELKRIMMVNGGTFHHYFSRSKTTHTIATNLPDSKVKALKGDEPICHPNWITDSLKEGRLLDFRKYLLYTAQSKSQPKIGFGEAAKPSSSSTAADAKVNEPNSGPTGRTLDANDSKFIGEYYNNSRLHHISTMGANFKQYVSELRTKMGDEKDFPARRSLQSEASGDFVNFTKPVIMHIDMDCFFVSVGLRKRPDLVGKPVAVAHAKDVREVSEDEVETRRTELEFYRKMIYGSESEKGSEDPKKSDLVEFSSMSELASCSYEARKCGVKNGMFFGKAKTLCPDLQTIPYDFDGYQEVAKVLYDTVASYALDIQAVSCDEMFVDITDVLNECRMSDPLDFAAVLRKEVFEKTQCRASVGLGPNVLLARMATRKAKPDGMFRLQQSEAKQYMEDVAVRDLPGVGRQMAAKLGQSGVETCGQLQATPLHNLQKDFGQKTGKMLYSFCRGIDERPIAMVQERKSVSAEVNYGIRFKTMTDCLNFLEQLSGEVASRMERLNVRGRCITLKLMVRAETAPAETSKFLGHGICDTASKSGTLSSCTREAVVIGREVKLLYNQMAKPFEELRGIGIQVTKLEKETNSGSGAGAAGTKSMLNFVQKLDRPSPSLKFETRSPPLTKPANVSFSQIDQDVLSELPDEIRKEIEESYQPKAKGNIKPSSHATRVNPKSNETTPVKKDSDLSFSQLDPDFLAALPEDLQAELKQQYSRKQTPASSPRTAFDAVMNAESNWSEATPKKRRGRPPKNSPRFIKRSNKTATKESATPRTLFEDANASPEPKKYPTPIKTEPARDEAGDSPKPEEESAKEEANLEGARKVPEVRDMLRSWFRSTDCPTEDDLKTVTKFLLEMADDDDLESVMLLLRFLLRNSSSTESVHWRAGCRQIIDAVQAGVVARVGCKLSLGLGVNR